MHAVHRCCLSLPMSHVSWSVCLYVRHRWAVHKRLNRSRCRLGGWLTMQGNCCRRSSMVGLCVCLSVCASMCLSVRSWALQKGLNRSRCRLRLTHVGPIKKEPFITRGSRSDEFFRRREGRQTSMQPFVKILWPLVIIIITFCNFRMYMYVSIWAIDVCRIPLLMFRRPGRYTIKWH